MNSKKIRYNENTQLFEEVIEVNAIVPATLETTAIEQLPEGGKRKLAIWLVIVIPTLSALAGIMGIIYGFQQAKTNKTQASAVIQQLELDARQFDITKAPHLNVLNVELEAKYDEKTLNTEYEIYVSKGGNLKYESWKSLCKYETKTIVIENTGAVINNATINVYTFLEYVVEAENETYIFAIDMNNLCLSDYCYGTFDSFFYNYNTNNKTFTLKYETDILRSNDEYEKLEKVFWKDMYQRLNAKKGTRIYTYLSGTSLVYLALSYRDVEGIDHKVWYSYNMDNDTLRTVNTYVTDQKPPQYRPLDLEYEIENSAYIAKILGYTNSQFKPFVWDDPDNSYIDLAEEKMINDIKKYFGK